jgi:nicotinamidase-related amidase
MQEVIMLLASLATTSLPATSVSAAEPRTLLDISGAPTPRLEPHRAALIVIDAQGEYARGPVKLEGLATALEEITRLRAWAKTMSVPVIHVRHEGKPGATLFAPGSPGAEFLPEATPEPGDAVVIKHLPNSFAGTNLQAVLTSAGRNQLILTGFAAHMCLDSTTRAALDLGYQSFIVARATADRDLPSSVGRPVVSADVLFRSTLAALGDRFAVVVPDSAALITSAAGTQSGLPCDGRSS